MTHKHTSRRRRRTSAVCRRHPSDKPTTGFCASCLRERLAAIEAQSSSAAALVPELRRTRSFSARNASAIVYEQPRRRSCDVRSSCSSLHYLVAEDEEDPIRRPRVPGLKEEEKEGLDDDEDEYGEHEVKCFDNGKPRKFVVEDSDDGGGGESKTMKELIDLERIHNSKKKNGKDLKEIASVLGKKLKGLSLKHQKNKRKEENPDADFAGNSEAHVRNGRSEAGERVLGRRSCDVDCRYSLDVGRVSFEEPRASWDGYVVEKTYPKATTLCSVTEDAKTSPEDKAEVKHGDEEKNPGGTAQTRDYYSDSRRRRSFDRSSSIKRPGLFEVDELKAISNVKVSPRTAGLFHGAKLLVTEKELRDSNWYSIKNHRPKCVQIDANTVGCVDGEVEQAGLGLKKGRSKWSKGWSIWGLIQRKNQTKNGIRPEKSLKLEGNSIEGSLAESLLKLRRVAKGEGNGDVCEKLIRSYSVSARKSCDGVFHGATILNGGFEGGRSSCDGLFHGSIRGGVEAGRSSCHLLQMKADAGKYSPNNLENGMLRFYFTPSRIHKMSKSGKSRMMD